MKILKYISAIQAMWHYVILGRVQVTIVTVEKQYTGCNRRNGPDFGRVFLMLNYTEKPQNTCIQS